MANAPPPNSAATPPPPPPPNATTTTTTIRPSTTTTTIRPSTTNVPPSTNDSTLGIGIGFGILAVLLLVAIIYACFLYRRLMRTAQINRRASNIFSKLSRKKVTSTNQTAADSPDAPGGAGGPRQESSSDARRGSGADSQAKKPPAIKSDDKSIYLDMKSSGTKGAVRTQKIGYVNQSGPDDTPPIYDTVNEVSFASDPPTYENFDKGHDNPIYENLEKKDTDPLYINITPTATPTPSPSHSPRGHKNLQAMKSSEYVLMSNSGPNTSL